VLGDTKEKSSIIVIELNACTDPLKVRKKIAISEA